MRIFELQPVTVPVAGTDDEFPVRRIYCIGRNYAKHVAEMGYDIKRSNPFFFGKPADAIVLTGGTVNYPSRTSNLHHEIELVVAIGKSGRDVALENVLDHVYGYAVGIDLTRRDLQAEAKEKGRPWEPAKGFDLSAPISPIHRVEDVGHPVQGRIWLAVNGEIRQDASLNELIWSVAESVAELSTLFEVVPGDLLYTGTPAGVGPLETGDEVTGGIEGIDEIQITIR